MTEFQQQVAAALRDRIPALNDREWLVNLLAPRVAAAIEAMWDAAHEAHAGADFLAWNHGARYSDEERQAENRREWNAALAALRGEA